MNNIEELQNEYNEFRKEIPNPEAGNGPSEYEWALMTQYASQSMGNALKAVYDAYRLGYARGKKVNTGK